MENKKNRNYNIFFNTHTVSGIVISLGLFVIFFCGAFALFMENIDHWETNEKNGAVIEPIDYQRVLDKVEEKGYDMHGRTFSISSHQDHINVFSRPLSDSSLVKSALAILPDSVAQGNISLELDIKTLEDYDESKEVKAHLGDFIYGLHYFRPIPVIGQYLSGLVALFFLFAIITGLIVHWEKIRSNFFTFRLKSSVKNLWTDAHTALGVIGLPFQLMYAVTGAIFGLTILIFMPYAMVLFGGDQIAMFEKVYPDPALKQYEVKGYIEQSNGVNTFAERTLSSIPDENVEEVFVSVSNYQDQNAHFAITVRTNLKSGFFNHIQDVYHIQGGEVVHHKEASSAPAYSVAVVEFIHRIHFADYGNYFVKLLYFLTALLTCFMIMSGVMIWLKARDKIAYKHKKKFNQRVGQIYVGASMGLFPGIALLFLLIKIYPSGMENRFDQITWIFAAFWLAYTIYSLFAKNYTRITRHALWLAGILGIAIPVANGITTGLWLWKSFGEGYIDTFFIDLSWLLIALISLTIVSRIKDKISEQEIAIEGVQIKEKKKGEASMPKVQKQEPVLAIKTSDKYTS